MRHESMDKIFSLGLHVQIKVKYHVFDWKHILNDLPHQEKYFAQLQWRPQLATAELLEPTIISLLLPHENRLKSPFGTGVYQNSQ